MESLFAIVLEVLAYVVVFYCTFCLLRRLCTHPAVLSRYHIDHSVGLDIACKSVSAVFATTATLAGAYIFLTLGNEGNHHATIRSGTSGFVEHIMLFAMAYFLYDVYAMYEVYRGNSVKRRVVVQEEVTSNKMVTLSSCRNLQTFLRDNSLICAHHLALAFIAIPALILCPDHEPGDLLVASALMMEASTPFVSIRSVLSSLGRRSSRRYVVNGLAMVAAFFCCRILIYPIFYYFYATLRGITLWQALQQTPIRCLVWLFLALLPQIYWFKVMYMGALKVLREDRRQRIGAECTVTSLDGDGQRWRMHNGSKKD